VRDEQLEVHGIVCSMSGRGNCYDNAAMESWFSTFKSELGERFESSADAKEQAFDYIEIFYNQRRIHSSTEPSERSVRSTPQAPHERRLKTS
jgi:transposase InsO family protein